MTPPLPALFNQPLTRFSLETVRYFVSGAVFLSVFGSCLLLHASLGCSSERRWLSFACCGFMIVTLSYPFYFLFDRGNIDGFVLLLITLALGCCVIGRDKCGGIFLALAIAFKVYPLLLLAPVVLNRRWKLLASVAVTLAVVAGLNWELWHEFLWERLPQRSGKFRIDENGSIACTFFYLGQFAEHATSAILSWKSWPLFKSLAHLTYVALFCVAAVSDWRRGPARDGDEFCVRTMMYFPFMLAVPQLAYHYEFVILIALVPLLCFLWQKTSDPSQQRILLLLCVGVALSQFQSVAWERVLGTVTPHFFPGLGLLLIMVGVTLYKSRVGEQGAGSQGQGAGSK